MNTTQQTRRSEDELATLSVVFLDDCGHMTINDFRACLSRYRQKAPYFPSPYDVLCEYNLLCKEREARELKALPMPTEISEEQAALNLKHLAKLREKIGLPMKKVLPDPKAHAQKVRDQASDILYADRGF